MKRRAVLWLGFVLITSWVLSGCGAKQGPKELMLTSLINQMNAQSYEFHSRLAMNVALPEQQLVNDPRLALAVHLLRNAELNISGIYRNDPQQVEMNVEMVLKGDIEMKFLIELVQTEQKLWIKIPNVPFLPLPETMVGKFLELDLEQLNEEQGIQASNIDVQQAQQFVQQMAQVLTKHLEEQEYFSKLTAEEVHLPEDANASNVVKFTITNDNLEAAIRVIVEKALPEWMEMLDKRENRELLQLSDEDWAKWKETWSHWDASSLDEELKSLQDVLTIHEFAMLHALDQDNHITYQKVNLDAEMNQAGQTIGFGLNWATQYSKINENVEFKIGIPEQPITMQELEELFGTFIPSAPEALLH